MPDPWRNRIVGNGEEAPDQLLANPLNWRIHPMIQQQTLEGVLEEVGIVQNVIVNQRTGFVVDGHLRVAMAIRHEQPAIPVTYVDLTPEEEAKVLASLDPIGAMAATDEAKLRELLADVDTASESLQALFRSIAPPPLNEGLVDPDEVPLPPDEPITQKGDLWMLGRHRLLCGDSGSANDLDRLLDGEPVDLLNTDPPYNVRVEPRSNNAIAAGMSATYDASYKASLEDARDRRVAALDAAGMHHSGFDVARGKTGVAHLARHPEKSQPTTRKMRAKDRPLENDFIPPAEFQDRLREWFGNAARVLRPGGSFYIWGGYVNLANYPAALESANLYFSQAIIWVKEHPVLGRKDFMGNHEWCFYGWKHDAAHRFFGPPNIPDVWPVTSRRPRTHAGRSLLAAKDPSDLRAAILAIEAEATPPMQDGDVWRVQKVSPQAMVHLTEKPVELARRAMEYSSQRGENVLDLFGGSGSTLIAAEMSGRQAFLMELDPAYCDVIVTRWEQFTGQVAKKYQPEALQSADE